MTSEAPCCSRFSAWDTFGSALKVAWTCPGPLTGFDVGSRSSVMSP